MAMNKKGFFYTIVSIMLIAFMIFTATTYTHTLRDKSVVIEKRVKTLNAFTLSLEKDLERSLYIASFRGIVSMQDHIVKENTFFSDINKTFAETVINGTVDGISGSLMNGSTIHEWFDKIKLQGEVLRLTTNITFSDFQVYQTDPWHVTVALNASYTINDTVLKTSFKRQKRIETKVNINGLEDPLYLFYTSQRLTNLINMTPYEGNYTYNDGTLHTENLNKHIIESWYTGNTDAPSFLMRFENDLSPSPVGIESFVNLQELSSLGITIYEQTCIDYLYWQNASATIYRINETPSWFYLDDNHLAKYNATGLTY